MQSLYNSSIRLRIDASVRQYDRSAGTHIDVEKRKGVQFGGKVASSDAKKQVVGHGAGWIKWKFGSAAVQSDMTTILDDRL